MENLKKLMETTGKNQRETGELLGISQVHVSRLLSGHDKPSKAIILSIERLLNGFQNIPVNPRSKALLEMFESLPEDSKKDIYRYVEKEKRINDLMTSKDERKAA